MAELEKIYGSDSGTDAIKKLDRNIRNVNLGIENIDVEKQVSEKISIHNTDIEAHPEITNQIGDLKGDTVGLGFGSSCVQLNTVGVTDIHEITKTPYRRCFGLDLINAPSKGFYFYEVLVHSVGYASVRATGFGEGAAIKRTFTEELINGRWEGWKDPEGEITALQKDTVNRKNGDGLGYTDGRSLVGNDLKPIYYVNSKNKNGLCVQLMGGVQIGLPDYALVTIVTSLPWSDTSGGVKQFAYPKGFNTVYTRYAIDDNTWNKWSEQATTERIDISSKLMGGWQAVDANCSIEATIIGGVLFVNGLIKNNGESSACLDLSQYPPKDGKWHGGSASSANSKYFVISPEGYAQFQLGYEKGASYTINFNYRVY